MLEDYPFDITFADNGRQAVNAYLNDPPDMVLMDIAMPSMNGIEAARLIRQHETTQCLPKTPIIAFTAHAIDQETETYFEAGMDDLLTKPFKKSQLINKLNEWSAQQDVQRTG